MGHRPRRWILDQGVGEDEYLDHEYHVLVVEDEVALDTPTKFDMYEGRTVKAACFDI